jgi:hypothetical protein
MKVGKKVFVGLESGGKSLFMLRESVANIRRNAYWYKLTGVKRPIVGNLAWSPAYYALAKKHGIEIIKWNHISELPYLTECDLYIDELQTYFDSRNFADLPLDVRLWLSQSTKMGVQIVGATQDFGMCDKSLRRLCNQVFYVQKILGSRRPMRTSPKVKRVWGIFFRWELDPRSFDGEQIEMKTTSWLPALTRLKKSDVKLFNTQERVALSDPPPLQKVVRVCKEDGYRKVRYY